MRVNSTAGIVKICGIREPDHAIAAAEAGADLIGFVFASARRQVTIDHAVDAIDAVRALNLEHPPRSVGVFLNSEIAEMNAVAEAAGLDMVQIHGEYAAESLEDLNRPYIRALRTLPGTPASDAHPEIARLQASKYPPLLILVDGYHPDHHGGAGIRADWELAGHLAREAPLILAGGLDGSNVGEAIGTVNPVGVDVSSGIEIAGVKDSALIEQFINAARTAFAAQTSK